MNQILETNLNSKKRKTNKLRIILKFQLFFSIILVIIIECFLFLQKKQLNQKENYSNEILSNYNISKLYSNINIDDIGEEEPYVLGVIKIPKINVYYPIFSTYTDDLLRISPCRFYGPLPGKIGNLCIAGHNYDNDKFFSKIATLNIGSEIIISDYYNQSYTYFVYNIYEVDADNLSPVYSYDKKVRQLTLITCNNINHKRIVVQAISKIN
ncbi:MAG: sortase [Clostridia bacterium]|nr:sortase [Clostridia bacterium]